MKYPLPSVQGGWQNFFSAKGPEMQLRNCISSLKLRLGPGNAVVQPHFQFYTQPWVEMQSHNCISSLIFSLELGNAVAQLHFWFDTQTWAWGLGLCI
jgi:hypothetical protein